MCDSEILNKYVIHNIGIFFSELHLSGPRVIYTVLHTHTHFFENTVYLLVFVV